MSAARLTNLIYLNLIIIAKETRELKSLCFSERNFFYSCAFFALPLSLNHD